MPTATLQPVAPLSNDALTLPVPPASAEAARYAVLRRMGSAIRHQIAGALQPVGMLASMLERRVQAPQPNMETLRKNSSEVSALARSASAECVALMGWLAPANEGELTPLADGVDECVHLLATELSFRGFSVACALDAGDALVVRTGLRTLLPACLMALTDAAAAPGEVQLQARREGPAVRLSLALLPQAIAQAHAPGRAKAYRALNWGDVQALGLDEGVGVQLAPGTVTLWLPLGARDPSVPPPVSWG